MQSFFLGTVPGLEPSLSESPSIPIRIFFVPWLIPTWAKAQAWWKVILVKRGVELTEGLLAHELAHILQWQSLGVFRFMFDYARYFLRHGYEGHPLETAARLAETDDYYVKWAREILTAPKKSSPIEG